MSPRKDRRRSRIALSWILGCAGAIGVYVSSGQLLVTYFNQHPSRGIWVGLSGYFLLLPGALWGYNLALRRARWARKHGVPAPLAAREWTSTRWEGVISAALVVAGGAISFAAFGINDGSGDAPAAVVGGLGVGLGALLGALVLLQYALVTRPATANTMRLLGDPLLVTQVAPWDAGGDCPIRVVYCARFRLGPRAFVEIDGRLLGAMTAGGAIGAKVGPGTHLVTVSDSSGARPLRMEVDAHRGQVTTVATTMLGAATFFTDPITSSAGFTTQDPDLSSPMAGVLGFAGRRSGTPIATTFAATSSTEPGEPASGGRTAGHAVDASAVALPIEIPPGVVPTPASRPQTPARTTGTNARVWLPALVTMIAGSALGAITLASLSASPEDVAARFAESPWLTGAAFAGPLLLLFGLPVEIRRVKAFAPPAPYPAGLIMLGAGAAMVGANLWLTTLTEWRVTGVLVMLDLAFFLLLGSIVWLLDPRAGVLYRSRRSHFARQRAWRAQPRAVESFAGEAHAGRGAIRASGSSTVEASFLFGLDVERARYEIPEGGAVGLYLRAGTQTIHVVHSSGLSARFEVEVMSGAVTPIEFGAPARRFLWLVPRRRALYARVGPPESGPLLLASG